MTMSRNRSISIFILTILVGGAAALAPAQAQTLQAKNSATKAAPTRTVTLPMREGSLRMAVFGDAGRGSKDQYDLANLMAEYQLTFPFDTVLTPRERRIVILAYWDRLAAGEIAELLRCSQGTVWTTLSRARRKLQSELGLSPIASAPRVEALSIARAGNTLRPSISAPGV